MLPDTSHHGHAEHFESLEQQAHAAHLGMWIFLASEVLLFAGLFALYAVYRIQHPSGFDIGLEHSEKTIGSINTAILLMSSYAVASAVLSLRLGRRARTITLFLTTIGLGLAFIALKLYEYSLHFREGIWPGAHGAFFEQFPAAGSGAVLDALLRDDGPPRDPRDGRPQRARVDDVEGRPRKGHAAPRSPALARCDVLAPRRHHLDLPVAALLLDGQSV